MPAYKEADGRHWFCKFYYRDYAGTRRQKMKRGFATRREAIRYEEDFCSGSLSGAEDTFEHIYEHYMEDIRGNLKLSTIENKRRIFETKILPFFGRRRMKDITPALIRRWQTTVEQDPAGFSATYLNTINRQLNALMSHAKRFYGIPDNPCERVVCMGTSASREPEVWTPEEYLEFRSVVKGETVAFLCFETLYWTGIRAGEMLALRSEDILLDKNELSISKTFQRIAGKSYVWEPKTESSVRRVSMPVFLCEELADYVKNAKPDDRFGRIFPVDDAWLCYRIHKYAKLAGLPEIKVHSLRHSAASLLIDEGFDALEVSRRLGHRRVSTTLDIYSHLFPTKQAAIARRLDEIGR